MTVYLTKRGALPWVSGEEFNFRYQSDYVTQATCGDLISTIHGKL